MVRLLDSFAGFESGCSWHHPPLDYMSVRPSHCRFLLNSNLLLTRLCCKSLALSSNCTFAPHSMSLEEQSSDHSRWESLQMWYAPAL